MNERQIPYIVFESTIAKEERCTKRLVGLIAFLLICWFATIGMFIWYITVPIEETTSTQTIDTDSGENISQSIGDSYGDKSNTN